MMSHNRNWFARHTRWLQLLAYILVAAAAIYSSARAYQLGAETHRLVVKQNQEAAERRDQICLSTEREHLRDVTALRNTYLYLTDLTTREIASTFNRFIIAQVPATEEKAHVDVAPKFCDQPGVKAEREYRLSHGKKGAPPIGLPEPDPVVPKRPEKVNEMLKGVSEQKPAHKAG